jgi:branched-chain amino acid transport system ATP-binding protein
MEAKPILEAQSLRKNFGAVIAAWDISAAIKKDAVVGLIGANGAGKTTFINMITGYLKPSSGTIHFQGRDITPLPPREITRLGVCRSFQIPQLYDSLTVEENILVGLGIVSMVNKKSLFSKTPQHRAQPQGAGLEAAGAIMERFSLSDYRDKPANVLPGGIRKLLDIAMSMVGKPQIMMLDEPTSGINADQKFDIMDMIMEALRAEGVTVLFVEHDMDIVSRYSERILAFYEGRIIADGGPKEVLADSKVRQYVIGGDNESSAKKGGLEDAQN